MDHAYIEDNNIVERYEMGRLSAAECASFEEHFVDCPGCQSQLALARDFRQALRTAHALEAKPAGSMAASPWRWAFVGAAACVLVLLVPVFLLLRQAREMNAELERARTASEGWRLRYEVVHKANAELQESLAQPEKPGPVAALAQVPTIASVFPLSMTRGIEQNGSAPVDRLVLSKSPQWVVLSLDVDGDEFHSYRASLARSGGQVLWNAEHLTPAPGAALSLSFPPGFFSQGDYLLKVEGLRAQGGYAAAGHYTFRVSFKP